MNRLLIVLSLACLLGGCHNGQFAKVNHTETVLTSNNYRVIQSGVKGTDTGVRVFGIGPHARYARALGMIRILAELEDRPRALVNVTEDVTWYHFGIVSGETITLTADVVEFTGPPNGR